MQSSIADMALFADGLDDSSAGSSPLHTSTAKSVQFNLNPQEQSPERSRAHSPQGERNAGNERYKRDDRSRSHNVHGVDERHHQRRDDSPDSVASDSTIELPPRFDQHGRHKQDDPLAVGLDTILSSLFK
jgi:hypothetical protein